MSGSGLVLLLRGLPPRILAPALKRILMPADDVTTDATGRWLDATGAPASRLSHALSATGSGNGPAWGRYLAQRLDVHPSPPAFAGRSRRLPYPAGAVSRRRGRFPSIAIAVLCGTVALFAISQAIVILTRRTGPFFDEGIYIAAGLRTLEGHGISDNYLTWFAGSLAWPAMAGLGFLGGGLAGARLMAAVCVTIALVATGLATRNLYGAAPAAWATAALAVNGPFFHLGHLAVYDTLSIAGIALSFWTMTEFIRRDHRLWLVMSALGLVLGVVAKYPMVVCGLPMLAMLVIGRRHRAVLDLGVFAFVSGAALVTYYELWSDQLLEFLRWRVENNPNFGVTTDLVVFESLYYGIIVVVLAPLGWLLAPRRLESLVLLGSLAIWPAYHILTQNAVGDVKHFAFGFIFAYPLVGVLLHRLAGSLPGRGVLIFLLPAIVLVGLVQVARLDRAWPDARPATGYLLEQARPGDVILANSSWSISSDLYQADLITTPGAVYDEYAVHEGLVPGEICDADWIVDEAGIYAWSAEMLDTFSACGTFRSVFVSTSQVTSLTTDLEFVDSDVTTTILRKVDLAGPLDREAE